jgi:hypothetical protein
MAKHVWRYLTVLGVLVSSALVSSPVWAADEAWRRRRGGGFSGILSGFCCLVVVLVVVGLGILISQRRGRKQKP